MPSKIPSPKGAVAGLRRWARELGALDLAVYSAVAATPTPALDRGLRQLSRAADHAKLWAAVAAFLAATGGQAGRRAAANGLVSVAVTSAVVNLGLKMVAARRRPDPAPHELPPGRHVTMPGSTSLPSGHAASAAAFATGVSAAAPAAGLPIRALAALVGYSRVHTGVHYPADVIAGAVTGDALAPLAVTALDRLRYRRPARRWPVGAA